MRHLSQVPPGPIFPGQYGSLNYLNTYARQYTTYTFMTVLGLVDFSLCGCLLTDQNGWQRDHPTEESCRVRKETHISWSWSGRLLRLHPRGTAEADQLGAVFVAILWHLKSEIVGVAECQPWSTKPLLNTEEACQLVSSPLTLSLWNILVVKWIAWHGSGAWALSTWDHWSRQLIDFGSEGKEDLSSSCSAIPSCRVSWLLTPLHPRGPAGWGDLVRVSQ